MFKVLLYTWIWVTLILVWLVVWYIAKRFLQFRRKNNLVSLAEVVIVEPVQPVQEILEESREDAAFDLEPVQENYNIQEEEVSESEEIVFIEEVVLVPEEVEEVEIPQEEILEPIEEEVAPNSESEEEGAAAEEIKEEPISEHQISQPTQPETLHAHHTHTIPIPPVEDEDIEVPKDYDGSRNIAMWHSRDDILRDKFEKHLQKIRYEAGILKQRSDMLGYEKKLVEWITLLPTDKEFQKQLADLYFHQGKYKKSQSLLRKILTDDPEDHYALWQMGEIAVAEGNMEDAYVYLHQAYNSCDDNPKYCFSLAQWYYDQWALEQSLPLMEKMVKLRPKNIEYLVSLSHIQHKIGMYEDAKESLLRALELDPMNVQLKQYLKAFT